MSPTQHPGPHTVQNDAESEALIGSPGERVEMKLLTEVDDTARELIERAAFVVVATCDADGRLDASPKRDPTGFVHVIDSTTLAIAERKENALGFGPRSPGQGPHRSDLPGRGQRESYRVNGTAHLTRGPELLDRLAVSGEPALMTMGAEVEEARFDCGKAMICANLWASPDDGQADRQPIAEQIGAIMGDRRVVGGA